MKVSSEKVSLDYKILWIGIGIFTISGILPWFVVQFPIGNLKISVVDIASYFLGSQRVSIDFYSLFIYGSLLVGWIGTLLFLIISAISSKKTLLLASSALSTIPPIIWIVIVPYLRIQMIFLSLSNQPINAQQIIGSGEVTAMIGGFVITYSFIKLRLIK